MFSEVRRADGHEDLSQLLQKQELMMYFSPFLYSRNFTNQNTEKQNNASRNDLPRTTMNILIIGFAYVVIKMNYYQHHGLRMTEI